MYRNEISMSNKCVENYMLSVKKAYGFCADPNLPTWLNVENYYRQMSPVEYLGRPTNAAFHNF